MPALLVILGGIILPETPVSLLERGKPEQARKVSSHPKSRHSRRSTARAHAARHYRSSTATWSCQCACEHRVQQGIWPFSSAAVSTVRLVLAVVHERSLLHHAGARAQIELRKVWGTLETLV